ncbi:hypothetical protein [Nocardia sp. BMG111209]|uniref:hypothetical protein n=1 Tax=Nocardia sp. BMG111209 TaxID=1160137 RepID=UPI00037C6485|nr:hypothetical protein [Nocardia sp. BMG111209]
MAVKKGQRFLVPFDVAFPEGAGLIGEIEKVFTFNERRRQYTTDQDVDTETGLLKWKARLVDYSDDVRGSDTGIDLVFLSPVQPIPPEGRRIRDIELEGLMVQPRVTKVGDFSKLTYSYFATGIKGDNSGAKRPAGEKAA